MYANGSQRVAYTVSVLFVMWGPLSSICRQTSANASQRVAYTVSALYAMWGPVSSICRQTSANASQQFAYTLSKEGKHRYRLKRIVGLRSPVLESCVANTTHTTQKISSLQATLFWWVTSPPYECWNCTTTQSAHLP